MRLSLGGIHDEAEIRGHRRTYIGALPGRIVRALRDAGTMNPVILLDEVDKVGADWRGDPSAALLEVLDPAQNHSFRDHYLDVEVDLSEVVFLATANMTDTIPVPLLDRMEVIGFDGYTTEEKLAIARGYLWPRQLERNGLRTDEVEASDAILRKVITEYTREAGVRQLERELGKLLRRAATRIASGEAETPIAIDPDAVVDALGRQRFFQESVERTATPGVATGLAVTGAGGDVLFIEATAMEGDKGLVLTGQLGDVMKESARIALSYVSSHADQLGHRRRRLSARVPRPRARRGHPQGWAERGNRDDHRTRVAAERAPRQAHRGDDRRGHPAGARAPDRGPEAEGARRPRGGTDGGDPAGAKPRRSRRGSRGGSRADDLPSGDEHRRGARAGAGACWAGGRCRHGVVAARRFPPSSAPIADLLERRWTLGTIYACSSGAARFNEFRQSLPGVSPTTLSERLEQLEDAGIVERRLVPGRPPHAEYRLTAKGRRLAEAVTGLLQHR